MNALNAAQRMQKIERFEKLTMSEYEALVSVNEQLRQRVQELTAERDEWEANSGQWEQEYYRVSKERDKATQYWQIAEGRCDALMKQRDDLVKAMEPFVRHNSSKSVIDLAIRTSDITKARAVLASAKEKA